MEKFMNWMSDVVAPKMEELTGNAWLSAMQKSHPQDTSHGIGGITDYYIQRASKTSYRRCRYLPRFEIIPSG